MRSRRVVVRAARVAGGLSRRLGLGGGSSIPGMLIERFDPGFVAQRAAKLTAGNVAVSGTNGKTTTTSMIRAVLREAGIATASNETGANMLRGVATALLDVPAGTTMGVFEIDEGWLPRVVDEIKPTVVVLTNVFRDQLDRFGEAESVAALLAKAAAALPEGARVVANADDPLLWEAVRAYEPVGFGVRPLDASVTQTGPRADAEPETCPRCGAPLHFAYRTVAHLGAAKCTRCDWAWTEPPHLVRVLSSSGLGEIELEVAGATLALPIGGLHNAYNAAAAVATADVLGVPLATTLEALAGFRPRFGRSEEFEVDGRPVRLVLTKNPAGTSVVIREMATDPSVGAAVVSVSDLTADGRDISWIWDADHERLAQTGVPLVPSGRRAADVAVRLKYAGAEPLKPEPDPLTAIRTAIDACPDGKVVVVLATYTAMLDVRRAVARSRTRRLADRAL
jgi:UDP-N-acetylmuramyl tripeptide synthase